MQYSKEKIIDHLQLQPHPEGGFFSEVYRSEGKIESAALPNHFVGDRSFATSIYFLLSSENFSAFHKINQDETWHFYLGNSIVLHQINPDGEYQKVVIGNKILEGERLQYTVPGGSWFAAEVNAEAGYSLWGCSVAPGFDFEDFTLAKKDELSKSFPQHTAIVGRLTRS